MMRHIEDTPYVSNHYKVAQLAEYHPGFRLLCAEHFLPELSKQVSGLPIA